MDSNDAAAELLQTYTEGGGINYLDAAAMLPSRPAEVLCGTPAARTVKDVRTGDFLVDRSGSLGFGPNGPVYLPFERIHAMLGDRITLDIPSSQIEQYASDPSAFSL